MVCGSTANIYCTGVMDAADSFDVQKAIIDLLADPARASFPLPSQLNAQQRKHAKKLVEQYPNVKCESFGLGKDRQMHLFKCNQVEDAQGCLAPTCSAQCVSVKNTFIDDWIDATGTQPADARVVQSMPHNMFTKCVSAEVSAKASPMMTSNCLGDPASYMEGNLVEQQYFQVGSEVIIDGLIKAANFNGALAIVQSWDAETGRYNVILSSNTANGEQRAKVKGENLRSVDSVEAEYSDQN